MWKESQGQGFKVRDYDAKVRREKTDGTDVKGAMM